MTIDNDENATVSHGGFLDEIRSTDLFSEFVGDSFDAREYANTVIEGHLIGESLAKLADGINILNKELMTQVSEHHEDLLSQATGIDTLEGVLQSIQSRCESLVKCVERVRTQVTEPYNRIASRTRQLRRLQTTCEYLRRIIRVLQLSKRLQTQMKGGSREITKAAQTLHELGYVLEGVDLSGIELIEVDLRNIKRARIEVEKQAKSMLTQGLNTQNQSLIGTALSVFHNLGTLEKHVDNIIDESTKHVENITHQALDANTLATSSSSNLSSSSVPGRATMPSLGNMASWNATLWEQLERLTDKLYEQCVKMYTLEKVLLKKRDPLTHVSFIEAFCEDGCSKLFSPFWYSICSCLRIEFDHSSQGSVHLKQAFEGEFPKLLRLFNDFWSQIIELLDQKQHPTTGSFTSEVKIGFAATDDSVPLNSLKAALQPFENAYLSRSLSRLFDPINLVFPAGEHSVPSKEELSNISKAINSELTVASVDTHLMIMIAKNVSKTIQLYTAKCEQILVTTPDAGQLSGGLTTAQIRNAAICNSLYQLRTGLAEILPNLTYPPQEAVTVLDDALNNLTMFMDVALSVLLSSIMASLQNKIARMQSEQFSITVNAYHETADVQPCSRYIAELRDFISRVQSDYLSLYNCGDVLVERLEALASSLLELFVRNASLLRDISEGGSLKLAADTTQLELAITPFCRRFEELGQSYKLFRAFRPLLFQTLEDIPSNPNIGDSLSYSTVLHFLFSKAPPQMLSPHTVAGWTVPQYSDWLDQHPGEEERIALIKGTLEAYSKKTRDQNIIPPPVYHTMMQLLERYEETKV